MPLFTRLTLNDNHWIIPSPHPWTGDNQGRPDIPFEDQYGFGLDEWLFNTRYHLGGYQYGYIWGLHGHHTAGDKVDRVYLYCVKEGQAHYIGYIDNVEILGEDWRTQYPEAADTYEGYEHVVNQEIREVGGDPSGLDSHEFRPVLRFKIDKASLAAAPAAMDSFPLDEYPGFGAYEANAAMQELFNAHHGSGG